MPEDQGSVQFHHDTGSVFEPRQQLLSWRGAGGRGEEGRAVDERIPERGARGCVEEQFGSGRGGAVRIPERGVAVVSRSRVPREEWRSCRSRGSNAMISGKCFLIPRRLAGPIFFQSFVDRRGQELPARTGAGASCATSPRDNCGGGPMAIGDNCGETLSGSQIFRQVSWRSWPA